MVKFVYDLLWWVGLFVVWPVLLLWGIVRGERLLDRLGLWRGVPKGCVWIHGSSLGECAEALALAKALRRRGAPILLTATTLAGYRRLVEDAPRGCVVRQQPLDHPLCVAAAASAAKPRLLVVLESDLWLGMISAARAEGARVIVASAKLSEKTLRRAKGLEGFFAELWRHVDFVYARSRLDAARFVEAGLDPQKVAVLGDLKLSVDVGEPLPKPERFPIVVAGSVRAKEEVVVVDAFVGLRRVFPKALLVLAPRHQDRFDAAARLLERRGIPFSRRSRSNGPKPQDAAFLIDTLGELGKFYSWGDIAIVGGTFADYGGHNPIEPVLFGVPVVHGPSTHSNAELFALVDEACAGVCVDADELAEALSGILSDEARLSRLKDAAEKLANRLSSLGDRYAQEIYSRWIKKWSVGDSNP